MIRLALRDLLGHKARLALAEGGVALALMLILAFDAIFTGVEGQMSAYIDHAGADVWVAQAGVRNLHMVASWLPASVVPAIRAVPGVRSATPILYLTDSVTAGGGGTVAYVIGLPPQPRAGAPWRVEAGAGVPGPGQAVIDRAVAAQEGVRLGDTVAILGRPFRVAGLSAGTTSLVNTIAFISFADFARLRGGSPVVSFVLVQADPGVAPEALAASIQARVPGVSAQARAAFAAQERALVRDMGADVVNIMNLAGLVIGLAVLALTVYTATFARRGEYGVLKALGVANRDLYRAVLIQSVVSVALGLALALLFTLLLAGAVAASGSALALQISAASLVKVGALALLIAMAAAILPVRQIAGVDPASVFRGGIP